MTNQEIIDYIKRDYPTQMDVYYWSTFILPDGTFVIPENDNDDYLDDMYEHANIIDGVADNCFNGSFSQAEDWLEGNCVKCNATYPYIVYPSNITNKQYWAAEDYLETIIVHPEGFDGVGDYPEAQNMKLPVQIIIDHRDSNIYDLAVYSPQDITKIVKKGKTRGVLEGLQESMSNNYYSRLKVGDKIKFTDIAPYSMRNSTYVLDKAFAPAQSDWNGDGDVYTEVVGIFVLDKQGEHLGRFDSTPNKKLTLSRYDLDDYIKSGEVQIITNEPKELKADDKGSLIKNYIQQVNRYLDSLSYEKLLNMNEVEDIGPFSIVATNTKTIKWGVVGLLDIDYKDNNVYNSDWIESEEELRHKVQAAKNKIKSYLSRNNILSESFEDNIKMSSIVKRQKSKVLTEQATKILLGRKLNESKKHLQEGPGAGYTINTLGYIVSGDITKINSVKKDGKEYIVDADCDFTGKVNVFNASSYGYGTGDIKYLPIEITNIVAYIFDNGRVGEFWTTDGKDLINENNLDLDELAASVCEFLETGSQAFVFGGGWSHVTYDGQLTNPKDYIDSDSYPLVGLRITSQLVNQDDIKKIDRIVSGDNYFVYYEVADYDDEYITDFDNEEDAIDYAEQHLSQVRYVYKTEEEENFQGDIDIIDRVLVWENDELQESLNKKFKKGLNEGPGAGYTISSNRYALQGDVGMVSVKKNDTHYIITATCDFVGTVKEFSAESYYSGTGEQTNLPIKLEQFEVSLPLDYEDIISELANNEEELTSKNINKAALAELVQDTLYSASCEFVYGGGWSHSTYDGQLTTKDRIDFDLDYFDGVRAPIYLNNQEDIDKVDRMTQGYGYETVYSVIDDDYDVVDSFDNEEDAIKFAKDNNYAEVRAEYQTIRWNGDIDSELAEVVWKNDSIEESLKKLVRKRLNEKYTVLAYDKDGDVYDELDQSNDLDDMIDTAKSYLKPLRKDKLVTSSGQPYDWIEVVDDRYRVYWASYDDVDTLVESKTGEINEGILPALAIGALVLGADTFLYSTINGGEHGSYILDASEKLVKKIKDGTLKFIKDNRIDRQLNRIGKLGYKPFYNYNTDEFSIGYDKKSKDFDITIPRSDINKWIREQESNSRFLKHYNTDSKGRMIRTKPFTKTSNDDDNEQIDESVAGSIAVGAGLLGAGGLITAGAMKLDKKIQKHMEDKENKYINKVLQRQKKKGRDLTIF